MKKERVAILIIGLILGLMIGIVCTLLVTHSTRSNDKDMIASSSTNDLFNEEENEINYSTNENISTESSIEDSRQEQIETEDTASKNSEEASSDNEGYSNNEEKLEENTSEYINQSNESKDNTNQINSDVSNGVTSEQSTTSSNVSKETTSSENSSSLQSGGIAEWNSTSVYVGGDKVVYQNRIYKAKWWTQGETPGQADVWEDTLETTVTPTTSQIEEATQLQTSNNGSGATITSSNFKVVGYYPSWKPSQKHKIQYDVLTHIIYGFAIPTAEGGLRPLENADTAISIINEAHASGRKVLLAIGGWSYNDTPLEGVFVSATSTEEKRNAFVNAILSMCDQYGFDGIDMDWEHPRVDGSSAKQYEAVMISLANELHKKGKILTTAVLSGATADGNIYYDAAAHSDKVLQAVDWINIMAYDGGDGNRHSSYEFAVNSAKYWKETRGLPGNKVVLGMPFYARPSWASYEDILAANSNAWNSDTVLYNGMEVWYNGISTIQKKTKYALQNLGGVMIWELTQDTVRGEHSLLTNIGKEIAGK